MGWGRKKRRQRILSANRNGTLRNSTKLEGRRAQRAFKALTRKGDAGGEEGQRKRLPSVEAARVVTTKRPATQPLPPVPRKEAAYAGQVTARTAFGTFGESLREKILDAVEPLWFSRVERDQQNRDAVAIAKTVLRKKAIRAERHPAPTQSHPLYVAIADRLPAPVAVAAAPVAPRLVEAAYAEKDIRKLVLFKGGMPVSRARAMFVFLSACMDAGLDSVSEIISASRSVSPARFVEKAYAVPKYLAGDRCVGCGRPRSKGSGQRCGECYRNGVKNSSKQSFSVSDLGHFSGLHSPLQNLGLYGFLARIRQTTAVWPLAPGIGEWASDVTGQRYLSLESISEYADRTRREWRRKVRTAPAEFYPYCVGPVTDDYAMVLRVHNAVPKGLPNDLRADICQELLVDLLTGDVTMDQVEGDMVNLLKQKMPAVRGRYHLSLDEPLPKGKRDEAPWATTRADVLESTCEHF